MTTMKLVVLTVVFFLTAVESAIAGHSRPKLTPQVVSFWKGVAQCETGQNWKGLGSTYQGGLGFYWATWNWWAGELGLLDKYPDAGDAPPLVQIEVAQYGRVVYSGYWGCIS